MPYLDFGEEEQAVRLLSSVIETRTKTLRSDDPKLLPSKRMLAKVLRKYGKLKEAEGLLVDVLQSYKRQLESSTLRQI